MAKSLYINKKEYLPSTVLAKQFGYSSDYISKLARDEKVLATQIGRTWYVEPESLKLFSLQTEIEKQTRKEELQRQRKVEQILQDNTLPQEQKAQYAYPALEAFAQTALVLLCGLFVGGLGFVSMDAQLEFTDLVQGSSQALALAVSPTLFNTEVERPYSALVLLSDVSKKIKGEEQFTDLPQFPNRAPITDEVDKDVALQHAVSLQFSDEVIVTADSNEGVIVQPVFMRERKGKEHIFVLSPTQEN